MPGFSLAHAVADGNAHKRDQAGDCISKVAMRAGVGPGCSRECPVLHEYHDLPAGQ